MFPTSADKGWFLVGMSNLTQMANAMSQYNLSQQVHTTMLRKAMDAQAQSVLPLLSSMQQTTDAIRAQAANPPHLGNRLDVRA